MAKEWIGYRRLYDSVACLPQDGKGFTVSYTLAEHDVVCRFSRQPQFPIVAQTPYRYHVAGDAFSAEFSFVEPKDTAYAGHLFTEIICWRQFDVNSSEDIASNLADATSKKQFHAIAEFAAGVIGLVLHRQLISEPLDDNYVSGRYTKPYIAQFSVPARATVQNVSFSLETILGIDSPIAQSKLLNKPVMTWLAKAWTEQDIMLKFLALFIPIEVLLKHKPPSPAEPDALSEQIRQIILKHGGENKEDLITFFNGRLSPPLNDRFRTIAVEARLPDYEADISNFKRFNSMRNKLLHEGRKLTVAPSEAAQLQEIAERYAFWFLLRAS